MTAFDISVITRFTRPQTVARTLESVRDQDWIKSPARLEVVIVDALGTEQSQKFLEATTQQLSSNYSRHIATKFANFELRIVTRNRSLKRAAALSFGIQQARGDLILFLDDDDIVDTHHIEKLFYGFQTVSEIHRDLVAVTTGVRLVVQRPGMEPEVLNTWDSELAKERLLLSNQVPLIGFMGKAKFLKDCVIDESLELYEDWDLILQLVKRGSFIHLPGISATYFMGPDHSGVHDPSRSFDSAKKIRAKWIDDFDHDDFEKLQHELAISDQLKSQIRVIQSELDEIKARYQLVIYSFSWRLTRPLRSVKLRLKRLLQRC